MEFFEKNSATSGLKIGHPNFEVIHQCTTGFQEIIIGETEQYGRALFLDGIIQSTEADEAIYHEMLVHPGIAHTKTARNILVAGAGEGASLRELLKHASVVKIDAVEIDGGMVQAAQNHLPGWHCGAFEDERVTVYETDIFDHLAAAGADAYDYIIVDLTDPIDPDGEFCAESLIFDSAFLRMLQDALRPGGCVIIQAGELLPALAQVLPALKQQFSWVRPFSVFVPSFHGKWTFLLLAAEDKSAERQEIEIRLKALEQLPRRYFSGEAYLQASKEADVFFASLSV